MSEPATAVRRIDTRSGGFEVAEAGEGPAVLLLHGWPELALSWRHQIAALAGAGYRAIAPNQRGYGGSHSPAEVAAYSIFDLVGDAVALLDALGLERAAVVGHDWGAQVAWSCALMRPDRFPAVCGLSVPYAPRGEASLPESLRRRGAFGFYILYFQEEGAAEREFDADPAEALRRIAYAASGDLPEGERGRPVAPLGGGLLASAPAPPGPMAWLPQETFARYVETFRRSGFRGGINWYRNLDRNWALTAPWHGAPVRQPSLFVAGARDGVLEMFGDGSPETLSRGLADCRGVELIEGAGHWIQQEQPDAVNRALLAFLKDAYA